MNTGVAPESRASVAASTLHLAVAVSWLGLLLHNVADLPEQYPWSPETAYPTVVPVTMLAVRLRYWTAGTWLLLGWAGLHVVGGGLVSVLPLSFLPYEPEHSMRHYTFHFLYGLTQLPLLAATWADLRTPAHARAPVDNASPREQEVS